MFPAKHKLASNRHASPPKAPSKLSPQAVSKLKKEGFSTGLIRAMARNIKVFAKRFWIVDNSTSMGKRDGHCIVSSSPQNVIFRDCSRWEEIQETVIYHMKLAETIQAPTEFRLLNKTPSRSVPQRVSIATDASSLDAETAETWIRCNHPLGCTPLSQHIDALREEVLDMQPHLARSGQRVSIIIATDGLPTDLNGRASQRVRQEFVNSLRSLEGLPVWLVIRLCTDDDDVVDFYNDLDNVLELSIDVLDDYTAEAKEVYAFNPWFNYALPIHRMREMGFHDRIFDLIDQSKITQSDVRGVCVLIFGDYKFDGVPDPVIDWAGFINAIRHLIESEQHLWNPIKKRPKPWLSINKLNRAYVKRTWF